MESLKVKLLDLKGPDVYAEASSAYIREAEKIEDHIGLIVQLTDQLVNSNENLFPTCLRDAERIAVKTHKRLKAFHASVSSGCRGPKKSLHRQTYKKLSLQFQTALQALDRAAASVLAANTSQAVKPPINEPGDLLDVDVATACINTKPSKSVGFSSTERDAMYKKHSTGTYKRSPEEARMLIDDRCNDDAKSHMPSEPSRKERSSSSWDNNRVVRPDPRALEHESDLSHPDYPAATFNACSAGYVACLEKLPLPVQVLEEDQIQKLQSKEKAQGMLQLEKDVRGIRELYTEMAWHLDQTSEDIDTVESQLHAVTELSRDAVNDVNKASIIVRPGYRRVQYVAIGCGIFMCIYWFFSS